jgi:hypothetical protein
MNGFCSCAEFTQSFMTQSWTRHDVRELLRSAPGSFVLIDSQQTKVQPDGWHDDFERPIYFVELRDMYIWSWCEVDGSQLVLLPSAQSGKKARRVRYPQDADIVGRVTAVTMCIAEVRGV